MPNCLYYHVHSILTTSRYTGVQSLVDTGLVGSGLVETGLVETESPAVVNGERIFYVDFCSLSVCIFLEFVAYSIFTFRYPTVNKYSAYPTGPRIELDSTHFTCPITDPQHLRQQVRGFAMAKVISTNFFPYM